MWLSVAVDEHNVPTDTKRQDCADAVAATFAMLRAGVTARDIMTKKAFQNAVTVQASVPLASPFCIFTLTRLSRYCSPLLHRTVRNWRVDKRSSAPDGFGSRSWVDTGRFRHHQFQSLQ